MNQRLTWSIHGECILWGSLIGPKTTQPGHKAKGPITKSISKLSQRTPILIQETVVCLGSEGSYHCIVVSSISRLYSQEVAGCKEAKLFELDDADSCLNSGSDSGDLRQVTLPCLL